MKITINKKITILFVLFFGVALFLFLNYHRNVLAVSSPDAIAVRVMPNESHISIERWYHNQGFSGSPQTLKVDGYDAIRDGRTVYVAAANAVGENLYTNIYLISYNQGQEQETVDIFGQILEHWRFNTNITETGNCSNDINRACFNDEECFDGNYCTSQKVKIIREVKRMANMMDIRFAVEDYREIHDKYPTLGSGTYIPGATISTWPSWQNTFEKELGISLGFDPINRMGVCSEDRFNSDTCWDDAAKEFDGNIPDDLPSGSRAYAYYTNNGNDYNACSILETSYANIQDFNCYDNTIVNRPPEIISVNLFGYPKQEFKGYFEAVDPDGDWLTYDVNLISPIPTDWNSTTYMWVWDNGFDEFEINNTLVDYQKEIHAALAGNASRAGLYQIEIVVDDGRGGVTSEVHEITIEGLELDLSSETGTMVIGDSADFDLKGTDASLNPFDTIYLEDATLDGVEIDPIASHGLDIHDMRLDVAYSPNQRTGQYIVNVYAEDGTTLDRISSSFAVDIINNPPVINQVKIDYSNNDECIRGAGCIFEIDNGENATIDIDASDPDPNHSIQYYLVDDLGGQISIDSSTGVITGLNKLNLHGQNDETYNLKVRVEDEYCANSEINECSVTDNFDLLVHKYCSAASKINSIEYTYPSEIVFSSGGSFDLMNSIGFPASISCSQLDNGTADANVGGVTEDMDIVFVVDTSGSMNGEENVAQCISECNSFDKCCWDLIVSDCVDCSITGEVKPIDNAISALNQSIGKIYDIVLPFVGTVSINVGLISYDDTVNNSDSVNLGDISSVPHKDNLISMIDNLDASGGTNTLEAMNRAETWLSNSGATRKIVILLSDGIPEVLQRTAYCHVYWSGCSSKWCYCGITNPCKCLFGPGPDGGAAYNTEADFKIAITENTDCADESCSDEDCDAHLQYYIDHWAGHDPPYQCDSVYCSLSSNFDCNLNDHVNDQATIMKAPPNNFEIYSIFYNTGGDSNANAMCDWSSDTNCPSGGAYAYEAETTDIDLVFEQILENIFKKPVNIRINGDDPGWILVEDEILQEITNWTGINNYLSCDTNTTLLTSYENAGTVLIKNIKFDYCPLLLHP